MKHSKKSFIGSLAFKLHPSIGKLYMRFSDYWNFALVGALGVVWQYLLTWLLLSLNFPWFFAMFIGILVAWNSNYFLNKHWVFKRGKR